MDCSEYIIYENSSKLQDNLKRVSPRARKPACNDSSAVVPTMFSDSSSHTECTFITMPAKCASVSTEHSNCSAIFSNVPSENGQTETFAATTKDDLFKEGNDFSINLESVNGPCIELHSNHSVLSNPEASSLSTTPESVQVTILGNDIDPTDKITSIDFASGSSLCEGSKSIKFSSGSLMKLLQDDLSSWRLGSNIVHIIDGYDLNVGSSQLLEKENIKSDLRKANLTPSYDVPKAVFINDAEVPFFRCNSLSPNDNVQNHKNNEYGKRFMNDHVTLVDKNCMSDIQQCNMKNDDVESHSFTMTSTLNSIMNTPWVCLLCFMDYVSSYSLEDHYKYHNPTDLSKLIMRLIEYLRLHRIDHPQNKNVSSEKPSDILDKIQTESQSDILENEKNEEFMDVPPKVIDCEIIFIEKQTTNNTISQPSQCSEATDEKFIPKIVPTDQIKQKKPPKYKKKCAFNWTGLRSRDSHPCGVCKKILSTRGNLAKHLIRHQAQKPWSCSACSIGFNSKRDCDQHYLQKHTNIRPFVCTICNKGYGTSRALKDHMIFHGSEKAFTCKLCGNAFRTSKCVKRHMQRHEANKKFNCELCSKMFRVKGDLLAHLKKIHSRFHLENGNHILKKNLVKKFSPCIPKVKGSAKSKVIVQKTKPSINPKISTQNILDASLCKIMQLQHTPEGLMMPTELFYPASSTTIQVQVSDLSSSGRNLELSKTENTVNLPLSNVISSSAQLQETKTIVKANSNENKIASDAMYVMVEVTEQSTDTRNSISSTDLSFLCNQELSSMQHKQPLLLDQVIATIEGSDSGKLPTEFSVNYFK